MCKHVCIHVCIFVYIYIYIHTYIHICTIHRAISVLDSDGDKSISMNEFLMFIYKVWRSQLAELAEKLGGSEGLSDEKIKKNQRERDDIKEAVKRNYPRSYRDKAGMDQSLSGSYLIYLICLYMYIYTCIYMNANLY
jgi:hypothetical protein